MVEKKILKLLESKLKMADSILTGVEKDETDLTLEEFFFVNIYNLFLSHSINSIHILVFQLRIPQVDRHNV